MGHPVQDNELILLGLMFPLGASLSPTAYWMSKDPLSNN